MKTIGLLSGKGGVGKTTSAINITAGLTALGKQSILVDANVTTPNVGLHLGSASSEITLHHVLKGKNSIHEAVQRHSSGIYYIPGSLAVEDMEKLKLSNLKTMKDLKADFIIVDGAAGLGKEALTTLEHCDELLIVTNPELPAMTDALKTIRIAEELGRKIKGVIVTRARNDKHDISLRNIEAMLEKPVIAVIPEDASIREALSMKESIVYSHPNSDAARSYMKLSGILCGKEIEDIKLSWIDKFFKIFKKDPR
ncbi:septum site-determining protein MinD [Candidatus Woesearchaeota archaeon]|nr:septum site-determining protein MinD [Candidatus Woesearchaeota archaeon]